MTQKMLFKKKLSSPLFETNITRYAVQNSLVIIFPMLFPFCQQSTSSQIYLSQSTLISAAQSDLHFTQGMLAHMVTGVYIHTHKISISYIMLSSHISELSAHSIKGEGRKFDKSQNIFFFQRRKIITSLKRLRPKLVVV